MISSTLNPPSEAVDCLFAPASVAVLTQAGAIALDARVVLGD